MIEEQIKQQTKVLTEIKNILDKSYQKQNSLTEVVRTIGKDFLEHKQQAKAFMSARVVGLEANTGRLCVKDIEKTVNDTLSVVEKDGEKFIRITALGEDFCLGLKLAEDGKEMKWQEAIDYCKERQRDLLTKRQYLIVAIFHDEINKMLESLGGDKLGYEWSVSEYSHGLAWYYYGSNGTLTTGYEYASRQFRPSLAHFSNL